MALLMVGSPVQAQSGGEFFIETKLNFRDSEEAVFPIPFPFPGNFLPPGAERGTVETVDPGEHGEVSRITLSWFQQVNPNLAVRLKLDTIDKYDRNPTSEDTQIDLDEAWLRYGQEPPDDVLPEGTSWYAKLGKFGKFERQDDRNLESYGLLSTAFNRFEDAGLELGAHFGRHFYVRASYMVGNPVFFRDVNTLAGDNGTEDRDPDIRDNPEPELQSGFPIFYDAELEDLDFEEAETGFAVGARFGDEVGDKVVHFMVFGYNRDLRDSVNMTGSFYGGDLDLLDGVVELDASLSGGLPISGRKKSEYGANLWLYLNQFTFFGQYVDQEMAELPRDGYEIEASYSFELPLIGSIGGKPILPWIKPAARYSEIDNDFTGIGSLYPAPTTWWDWKKFDFGLNALLYPGLLMTVEYADNQFLRGGVWEHADEFLVTLSWKWRRSWGDLASE
ncbi:hypothetical protein [Sulfidibacter corallicola]|uniref:Uncharacterized protein n=1 Tax=Sulfidibacter corallicola TaxID=2818388 RepID=A0A8A4TLS3_SULCO|nr:hypothetical protein [Sulfidibacter corallicola]QTD50417.1 hypothetical protein J3U87_32945 [Sulfidibacter corallicola]